MRHVIHAIGAAMVIVGAFLMVSTRWTATSLLAAVVAWTGAVALMTRLWKR